MKQLPKLRYPIHTKGLSLEERAILLAYDIIQKASERVDDRNISSVDLQAYRHDLEANLANLGHIIESKICGGDLALRFEGYDNAGEGVGVDAFPSEKTSEEIIKEWNEVTKKELNK